MTTQEITTAAQQVINFKLKTIKFHVRRKYREASQWDRLSGAWLNTLCEKVDLEIRDIAQFADSNYSYLNIAVAAMKETKINAKKF